MIPEGSVLLQIKNKGLPFLHKEIVDKDDVLSVAGVNWRVKTSYVNTIEWRLACKYGVLLPFGKLGKLLKKVKFDVIRGNISEIKTLAVGSGTTKGVDADVSDAVTEQNLNKSIAFAKEFAAKTKSVIAITGAIDLVCDSEKCYVIRNGRAEMGKITGTGCQLSGMTAAFITANPDNILEATAAAVCAMGLAGQLAWEKMQDGDGNSTYRNRIIDAIYNMTGKELEEGAIYEIR